MSTIQLCPDCHQAGRKISSIYREEYIKSYAKADIEMSGLLTSSRGSSISRGYDASVRSLAFKSVKKPSFSSFGRDFERVSTIFVAFILIGGSGIFFNTFLGTDDTVTTGLQTPASVVTVLTQNMGYVMLVFFCILSLAFIYTTLKGKNPEEIEEEKEIIKQYEQKKTDYELTWYCETCDLQYIENR